VYRTVYSTSLHRFQWSPQTSEQPFRPTTRASFAERFLVFKTLIHHPKHTVNTSFFTHISKQTHIPTRIGSCRISIFSFFHTPYIETISNTRGHPRTSPLTHTDIRVLKPLSTGSSLDVWTDQIESPQTSPEPVVPVPGTHFDLRYPVDHWGPLGGLTTALGRCKKHDRNRFPQHVVQTQVKHSEPLHPPLYRSLYTHNTLVDQINPSEKYRGVTQPVWHSFSTAENTQNSRIHFTSQNGYKHATHASSDVKHA
jgi:hypothetical protein